jgi:hypothetical protein
MCAKAEEASVRTGGRLDREVKENSRVVVNSVEEGLGRAREDLTFSYLLTESLYFLCS